VLVRVAPWVALGSALKEDVGVRLAVFTMALPGDTHYAPGAGVISRSKNQYWPVVAAQVPGLAKRAPAKSNAPLNLTAASNAGLHFLRALLGGVVPHAARLVATSLVGRLGYVSSEGWAGEGKCQRQRKHRNKRFHGHYSLDC
jgi:hypothetical protein